MSKTKRQLWFELTIDILDRTFHELCREHKIDAAEELLEIIRRLMLLKKKV